MENAPKEKKTQKVFVLFVKYVESFNAHMKNGPKEKKRHIQSSRYWRIFYQNKNFIQDHF